MQKEIKNIKTENRLDKYTSLEDLIISTNMNGWILQLYLKIFGKGLSNIVK